VRKTATIGVRTTAAGSARVSKNVIASIAMTTAPHKPAGQKHNRQAD
jgi:hypothetical protein